MPAYAGIALDAQGNAMEVMIMGRYPETYVPGRARAGQPTPQSHPGLFAEDEVKAEISYLLGLNRQFGTHVLRVNAAADLSRHLDDRAQVSLYRCPCCGDDVVSTGPVCADCQGESCDVTVDACGERGWWECQRSDTDSE